ncbi:1-phosphatidylinositol 4,5-bisphosphate phosphodiesterase eta-1 [Trichomycterus rosablanca]|uniref:1-phosphatidylinositol 4,5-bisphosphate phosphodiesterase eta-1 n=1 Tax=Trichomycterus rosablanca TaxID=2290929 RepID=UPI002F35AE87
MPDEFSPEVVEVSEVAPVGSLLARRFDSVAGGVAGVAGGVAVPQKCRLVHLVERCMSVMQSGTQMVKLKNGSKGLVRLFYLDEHRSCIRWKPSRKSEKAKITIDSLYKVTEGCQSDLFHRHAEGNFDPGCCFTIYHGNHMDSLDLVTSNAEEARTWVTGLRYLMAGISDEDSLAKRQRTHDQWMKQTFEEADKNGDGFLNIDEIYQLLHKMNVNLPRRKVKQMFQEADTDEQQGTLTFEEFSVFYRMMSLRRDLFLLLMSFSERKDHLTAEELGNFLRAEQKMSSVTSEFCLDIIQRFEVSEENKQKGIMGIEGFTNYMRSPACDVFNPQHNEVNQDMEEPLSSYFISSSHNTYLTGDQLLSHSKTDMYAWVLQGGCRCIEVDCWDGPDGEPMVQHGYTLTSKITFKSVIETINKYAFINNQFPVILSIENHCSIQQQKKIAQHLKEILKEKLEVLSIFSTDFKQLPTPSSLKNKILIKGKRLPAFLSADAEEGEVSDDDSADEIEDDFKLKSATTSNGPTQHQVETKMRKKLDSLIKESQIGDKEDTDSFSIRALLRATHEGLQKNLHRNSKDGLKKSQSRSFISNLKQKRHSKSKLKCQSVETEEDGQQETGGQSSRGGRRRKTMKLSRDLSDLVVFTNSVVSQECLDEGSIVNVLSFSETRAHHLVHHRAERFLTFNQQQLSRIYPSAYRIDSSNFNPQTYWNVGCQLVALNYQTEGRMMQLNRAKFMVNGGCGYVLKPPPMCKGSFNPHSDDPLPAHPKKQLLLKIISGQQLPKPPDSMLGDRGEIIDPFVEVEIIGLPVDCCKEQTRVVDDNGFNPVWEETLSFTLHMPEIALVRFLVWDHDPIGRDFVGQRTVAFSSLMPGYRHVYLEGMTEASIFVHISVHDIYGKWSPLVLNPSYTILHLLGANKGRQLRGFRSLFSRGSKCSVDTQIGGLAHKRSSNNHLLRRTASAPAKGRKKTKMLNPESSVDRKDSNGEVKTQAVERTAGPRMTLQHRPASMPPEGFLQGRFTVSSNGQDAPDAGIDTITGSFLERNKSVSVDLLTESSTHDAIEDGTLRSLSEHHGEEAEESKEQDETSYLVMGSGGESSTDGVLTEPQPTNTKVLCEKPAEGRRFLLDHQDRHLRETHTSGTRPLSPRPPSANGIPANRTSLQDSVLSRLIDAVSLGNENDTHGSISALIGQFEVSAEQSNLNLSSSIRPSQPSNQLSSTPLKRNQESSQKDRQVHPFSSPETTELAAFTILDEQVLSPVVDHDLPDRTICPNSENNPEFLTPGRGRGLSLNKAPFERARDTIGRSCRDNIYQDKCRAATSRTWEFGGYRETSINSTVSERFLLCQDSASSSLMEVELNVDGDPLDMTLTLDHNDLQYNSDPKFSNQARYFTRPAYELSVPVQGSLHLPPLYRPNVGARSTESLMDTMNRPHSEMYRNTCTDRHFKTSDMNGLINKAHGLTNGYSSSDCLSRTQEMSSSPRNGSYKPATDHDVHYSSVVFGNSVVTPKQYTKSFQQNHALKPTTSECYKGIYLVGSPIPKASSPCKSKSLGDLTSEDISSNFQSKYKVISRSFITPAMRDQRRMCGMTKQTQSTDPLTAQLRKLVTLEETNPRSHPPPSRPTQKSEPLQSAPPSVVHTESSGDLPPLLSRRLSSRSQSRVRHIANRARERQQEALKSRPAVGASDVVLRNKTSSSQNGLINRHSTGSYIAGYLEQGELEDRGLPEGSCMTLRGYKDQRYVDDSSAHDSCNPSEPEVYFLLRI